MFLVNNKGIIMNVFIRFSLFFLAILIGTGCDLDNVQSDQEKTKQYIIKILERSSKKIRDGSAYAFNDCILKIDASKDDYEPYVNGSIVNYYFPINKVGIYRSTNEPDMGAFEWSCDGKEDCLIYEGNGHPPRKELSRSFFSNRMQWLTNEEDGLRLAKAVSHLRSLCTGEKELFD